MTHPLTPREKVEKAVERAVLRACNRTSGVKDLRLSSLICGEEIDAATDDILTTLASGSGDHAELARLAEAAEHDPEYDGRSFEVAANPATVLALLTEIAALRGDHVHLVEQKEGAEDALFNALSRATEAERELGAVSSAIGTARFVDPPDGGDVPLSEQVRRMASALTEAERKLAEHTDIFVELTLHHNLTPAMKDRIESLMIGRETTND